MKFKKIQGAGDVAQLAGYFPSMHEALGLITSTHTDTKAFFLNTCLPSGLSSNEVETE